MVGASPPVGRGEGYPSLHLRSRSGAKRLAGFNGPELDGGVPQGAFEGGPAGVHTPAGAAQ
jgi:hypothetical protein